MGNFFSITSTNTNNETSELCWLALEQGRSTQTGSIALDKQLQRTPRLEGRHGDLVVNIINFSNVDKISTQFVLPKTRHNIVKYNFGIYRYFVSNIKISKMAHINYFFQKKKKKKKKKPPHSKYPC